MSGEIIVDLSEGIEAEDMPICPICDNAIYEHDPYLPIIAHGMVGIAHQFCIIEKREELGV